MYTQNGHRDKATQLKVENIRSTEEQSSVWNISRGNLIDKAEAQYGVPWSLNFGPANRASQLLISMQRSEIFGSLAWHNPSS